MGIACGDRESALRKVINEHGIKWDNYFEKDKISSKYGVTGYPTKILIGPDGKVLFRYDGEHPDFYKEILNYL